MYFLGLSVEGGYILAALYRRRLCSLSLCKTEMFPMGSSLNHILSHLGVPARKVFFCSTLPVEGVLLYTFPVEVANAKIAEEVLPFQLEERLGHSLEGALVSINVPQKRSPFPLSILTVQKRLVEEHISQWREKFIDPDFVVSPFHALGAFLRAVFPQHAPPLLLHFFSSEVVVLLFDGEILLDVHTLSLTEGETALQRLLAFFSHKAPGVHAAFTGNLVEALTFCPRVKDLVQKHFTLVDFPASWIPYTPYALSMGVALWSAQKDSDVGHFREAPSMQAGVRAKKMWAFAAVMATTLFMFLVVGGEYILSTKEAAEACWIAETFHQKPSSLSEGRSILQRERAVRKGDPLWQAFSFPSVDEVLEWIQEQVGERGSLEEFLYQIPAEQGKGSIQGEFVRVDLSLHFLSEKEGQNFCESLARDPGVCPGSCNFSSSVEENGLFQISFFLRNKRFWK